MADSRETYIHRLGRTARAGKKGHGVLVLSEIEKGFLKMLQGLDIKVDEELHELAVSPPSERVLQQLDPVLESIRTKRNSSLFKSAEGAYRGMMGYYKGNLSRVGIKSLEKCVEFVNSYALQSGLDQVPTFTERTARNMGMYGVAGIKCGPDERGGSGGGGGGSSSYRGGGGRGEAKSTRNNRSSKNKGEAGWWQ
jgi:ATP-dependent RNA helicase MSS116